MPSTAEPTEAVEDPGDLAPTARTTPLPGAPSEDDISAVNKIIQRISLLTGELRDASGKEGAEEIEPSPAPEKRAGGAG